MTLQSSYETKPNRNGCERFFSIVLLLNFIVIAFLVVKIYSLQQAPAADTAAQLRGEIVRQHQIKEYFKAQAAIHQHRADSLQARAPIIKNHYHEIDKHIRALTVDSVHALFLATARFDSIYNDSSR